MANSNKCAQCGHDFEGIQFNGIDLSSNDRISEESLEFYREKGLIVSPDICARCGGKHYKDFLDQKKAEQLASIVKRPYKCVKCGHSEYRKGKIYIPDNDVAAVLDNEEFVYAAVSCGCCGYTELYSTESLAGENVLDLHYD